MEQLSKYHVKKLHAYVERIQDVLETLSLNDDDTLVDSELLDRHYEIRDFAERALKKLTNPEEVY